uniref:Recep_L_domain domain-containing protein n=1 Tax=Caenorhabditis tropicalis TaxID=1561998 RepID=A0A1I7TY40_9PELO
MECLVGGVLIENTSFTNISFFTKPADGYISFDVELYGFIVRNNPELTDANMLWSVRLEEYDDQSEPEFRIENNPKLDAKRLCDYGYLSWYSEVIVHKNLRDCACPGGIINASTIKQYENCESIFNGIKLYNITGPIDLSPFYNVKFIRGPIDIQNTNLKNLSFLANVGDQKVNSNNENPIVFINLKNNPEMTRLRFPVLMEIQNSRSQNRKLANFENLHPDFCLTVEEMAFLIESYVTFINLHARICPETRTKIQDVVLCRFETMSKLPEGCNLIMGDLIINSGDEGYFPKLESVRYLFGSLSIQNTSLEDTYKFENLRYIVQLDDTYPVIQMVGNKKMKDIYFSDIKSIQTRQKRIAVFQDNNKKAMRFLEGSCELFQDEYDYGLKYRASLTYLGGNCGKKVHIEYRYPSGSKRSCLWSLFLFP